MPGCIEHTGVITQLLKDAKANKGDLAVLWLDLKNAYASIPHSLVQEALKRNHVPNKITEIIGDYYSNFQMRMVWGNKTSAWHYLERGIVTCCTISAMLFALAMNKLIKAAEVECRGPTTRSGQRQPPIRAYMDDMTLTSTSVIGARWLLRGIENLISWARMSFNARKSCSQVLKKGKLIEKRFKLSGEFIPTIKQNPVKSQGKCLDDSLKDTVAIQETNENLDRWLNKIERSGLPGRFKAWIYQNAVLPKVLWQLTIYEFTSSSVEQLEKRINSRLCRWLGLLKCLNSTEM